MKEIREELASKQKEEKIEEKAKGAKNPENKEKDEKSTEESADAEQEKNKEEKPRKEKEPTDNEHCHCHQPWDETRPMLSCKKCDRWFHGECVEYKCKQCTKEHEGNKKKDELIKRLKEQIEQLKAEVKNKNTMLKEEKQDHEKLKKKVKAKEIESNKEERDNKKKDEKQQLRIETLEKEKELISKDKDRKTAEMGKEIENLRLEITSLAIHVQQLKKDLNEAERERNEETLKTNGNQEQEEDAPNVAPCTVPDEATEDINSTEDIQEESDDSNKKKLRQLKAEIARYETRLEATLTQLAEKSRTLLVLLDDHEMIIKINEELEKHLVVLQNKNDEISKDNERKNLKQNTPLRRKKKTDDPINKCGTHTEGKNEGKRSEQKEEDAENEESEIEEEWHESTTNEKTSARDREDMEEAKYEDKEDEEDRMQNKGNYRKRKSRILCRYHQKGYCRKGKRCRYAHSDDETSGYEEKTHVPAEDELYEQTPTEETNRKNEIPCRDHLQNHCKEGDGCEISLPKADSTQAVDETDEEGEGAPSTIPCRFYLQNRCTKGDDCRFTHPKADWMQALAEAEEPTTEPTIPCRYHLQSRCMKGENCRFSHEKAESLRKINILKENLMQAFDEAKEEVSEDPTKNLNKGIQLKKLYSLKNAVFSGLREIARKVKQTNLAF
jgi:hypothetical protein